MQNPLFDQVFSVSEYLDLVNELLLGAKLAVRGEITELKVGSQWIGFTLKDKEDGSLLKCVLGVWQYRKIGLRLEDGMEIKVTGQPKISKKWGSLGYWVETIEPLGEGSLKKAYELLLKQLKLEGLYDRKRAIPEFSRRLAVISSRDGVVIHDLQKNLKPLGYHIDFLHTNVEGAKAVSGIVDAIEEFNRTPQKYDVLIIIRGGGSLESLQAFNNEAVCRALYASKVPVVVGIGHDVDVPIACLIADASGSTPTQVAHILNDTWRPLFEELPNLESHLITNYDRLLERTHAQIDLRLQSMQGYFQRIFDRSRSLIKTIELGATTIYRSIQLAKERISNIERLIEISNPERNLALGYSIVFNERGRVLKHVKDVKIGEQIRTKLSDGEIKSEVTNR